MKRKTTKKSQHPLPHAHTHSHTHTHAHTHTTTTTNETDMLNKVSRSFAIVIQQLPHELQDAVCIFYLVLRALDTVEDDMSIPEDVKCPELEVFWKKIYDPEYVYPCG